MISQESRPQRLNGNEMFDAHQYYMQEAYELAKLADQKNEVPIGAIVVYEGKIIGKGHNSSIEKSDPTAHAEIIAMREAGNYLSNYRLLNCTLYVTLEPCIMCAGAMVHARIKELIFAAYDPKAGAITNAFELFSDPSINHQIQWRGGVKETQCSTLLKEFFHQKRG